MTHIELYDNHIEALQRRLPGIIRSLGSVHAGQSLSRSKFLFELSSHLLLSMLILSLFSTSSMCMELNLSFPEEVDLCEPYLYSLDVKSTEDADDILGTIEIPEFFHYAGGSKIAISGTGLVCEPTVSGRSIRWDLSAALISCRQVVINEFELNPKGPDSGKEWVELYNPSSLEVSLGNWMLVDSYYRKTVMLPQGTVLPSKGRLVATWTNGSLINSRPVSVSLYDASGTLIDCTLEAKDDKDDDSAWARVPEGKDRGNDDDWAFQASTEGVSNGGRVWDLYSGESFTLSLLLVAGCTAHSGESLFAQVSSTGGLASVRSQTPVVKRANLSLSAVPDRFEAAKGDIVKWKIHLQNDGNGTARGILINSTLSPGLELLSINSPNKGLNWSYSSLCPGEAVEVELLSRVLFSFDYYSYQLNASWGCGPCQEVNVRSGLGRRTAIRKLPDNTRSFCIGEDVDFQIEADFPSNGARDLWINDTLPRGLIYNSSSLSCRGADPKKLIVEPPDDISSGGRICWFFGDVISVQRMDISYSAKVANDVANQDGLVLEGKKACLTCSGGKADCDEAGAINLVEPDLALEKRASTSAGDAGDEMTYTLSIYHSQNSHATAFDVDVADALPSGLRYSPGSAEVLSGPPGTFDARGLKWHFDSIDQSWSRDKAILLRYNATLTDVQPGMEIINNATLSWSSLPGDRSGERDGSGGVNDYMRRASFRVNIMRLSLIKLDDPDPVGVGETLTYTLIYENQGATAAHNVTISDELDPRVIFLSSDPLCSAGLGVWKIPVLLPDGPHSVEIDVKVGENLSNGTVLSNRFSIESDELEPKWNTIHTDVLNKTRLAVNKTAMQKAVRRGEEVAYVINICNLGGQRATNVTVRDVFDSRVELIWASSPSADGIWRFEWIDPGECLEIDLVVRVPREDVQFSSSQKIVGTGFLRVSGDYTTSLKPYVLTNSVYVASEETSQVSDVERVNVLGEAGTDLKVREHGSGSYEDSEILRYLSSNKSLKLNRSIEAHYAPSAFLLPENRSGRYDSRWSQAVYARNGITSASFEEIYRYATKLSLDCGLHLDENGSDIDLQSYFQGAGHFGMLKKALNSTPHDAAIFASLEDYTGSFKVYEKVSEHGKNVLSDISVSGSGFAAADKRIHESQRSYEAGTGPIRYEEQIQTATSYLAKEIEASHESMSYRLSPLTNFNSSMRWQVGMWTRNRNISFIGEKFSAGRLKKSTVIRGASEMETEADFSGRAEFRTEYKDRRNKTQDMEASDEFLGEYHLKRRVLLDAVSRFDQPHLSIYLADNGSPLNSSFIKYTITVQNDGNHALGPIYIRDLFPPGTKYISSSVGPSELTPGYANWTLLSLGIGGSSSIELDLNVTNAIKSIVNRVDAIGGYDDQWVSTENFSVIQLNWLPCCQPNILVSKEAVLESGTKNIVDYRITLHNPSNYTMAVSVVDVLPSGMRLLGSSMSPSDYDSNSNRATWKIIDLLPNQTKIIEYRALAEQSGVLVNVAHVEAFAVGGQGSATAEATAKIEVSEGKSGDAGGWKAPACFDLNYSASCAGDDLAACYSCGDPEKKPEILCASCALPDEGP